MIGTIEQKIVDALTNADFGYDLFVAPFKATDDRDISVVIKNHSNSALIVCTGERDTHKKGNRNLSVLTFSVLLIAKNVRNERAARTGDSRSVGVYQMISDVKAVLHDNLFDVLAEMKHVRSTPLNTSTIKDFHRSIWLVEFDATYCFDSVSDGQEALSDFIKLNTVWDMPDSGQSETTLTYERTNND